jgi:hypothetical protein
MPGERFATAIDPCRQWNTRHIQRTGASVNPEPRSKNREIDLIVKAIILFSLMVTGSQRYGNLKVASVTLSLFSATSTIEQL